jgi:SAM-dependent methyltransferase
VPDDERSDPVADRAALAGSFGGVAAHYERFRPGPSEAAVDWYLPDRVGRVVDLGAGTGALTRLLVDRADEVIAVEPDDRMRAVLADEVPGARAVPGTGEALPVEDASADAVLASTSWHWMDPEPTLAEVARVLVPGGFLGASWTGADPDGPFLSEARRRMLAARSDGIHPDGELLDLVEGRIGRGDDRLVIPADGPFDPPDRAVFTWDIALDADELLGLLGTFSWVITLTDEARAVVLDQARELLAAFGIVGTATVDVAWRTDAWRSRLAPRDGRS